MNNTTTPDHARTHTYTGSGCIHQWKDGHDTKHCIATFKTQNR